MKNQFTRKFTAFILMMMSCIGFFLAGCASQEGLGPVSGIESYLKALANKDSAQLVNASCADWEEDALQELRTFDAVNVTLENLDCQEAGQDVNTGLVVCEGKIVANYGNEVLEINLKERTYQAVQEGGEWRMCGYR